MNFDLTHIPKRKTKPRDTGLTMMMDKGLSLRQVEDFIEVAGDYTDIIKLGFGTAYITKNLKEKIKLYQDANLKVYFGGTFFEAHIVRNKLDSFVRSLKELNINTIEVSDGSIILPHDKKCEYIKKLSKDFTVLSEVGSKEEGILISPNKWISMMQAEIKAGAWKVIAEARESGTVGIYRPNGKAHVSLINQILAEVHQDKIMWEAPKKAQQAYFIKLLGSNVNLGNIGSHEVIPLETLRIGLRGDTFFSFLPKKIAEKNHHA